MTNPDIPTADPSETDPANIDRDSRRRSIRTAVQSAVAACAVLLVIVPIVLNAVEPGAPPRLYAALATGAAAITTIATLVTRIMTHPVVAAWIDRYAPWLSADPTD